MSVQRITVPSLLVHLLVASVALVGSAVDLYGNAPPPPGGPAPPPPFAVRGKTFPPESTFCIDPTTPCFGKTIQCPASCPMTNPADAKAKACHIDCANPLCAGECRSQGNSCEGKGAACQDPRFVGGDGIMFYFHGKASHHFALVSDPNLQINAHFIGLRPQGRPRDFTWIQALGILFDTHTFTVAARRAVSWDADADHLDITYDGVPVPLDEGHRASWSASDDASGLRVVRRGRVNSATVTLPGVFELMLSAVPVTQEDSRVHRYGIPDDDCFAHLEVQFRFSGLSEKVEGVLGQTYRPDFHSPVKRGVPMPVMGGEDRYMTSSLLAANCNSCMFSAALQLAAEKAALPLDAATLECTSKMSNGYGVVCRR
ncbi:hypothetical protein Taro_026435 [Colocasia esculenta]|uniref:Uncharacterized protein n=1 Tax=Colocasia esculenta TaxID=4460 RepID=A0A843VF79_COLES|nr:hypothetical protein [Colocasia esculenta]